MWGKALSRMDVIYHFPPHTEKQPEWRRGVIYHVPHPREMDNHAHIMTINRMRNTVVGTQWAERDKSRPYAVLAD